MKQMNVVSKNRTDDWLTPPEIINSLGKFDLDPCSPTKRPWDTAKKHFTFIDNGLLKEWFGRVWLNPPYSNAEPWLNRMALHDNGIALLFTRTDTKGFQQYVFPFASSIMFVNGRITFCNIDGTRARFNAGAPSVLVAYNENNSEILESSPIRGTHIPLVPEIYLFIHRDNRTWRIIISNVLIDVDKNYTLDEIYRLVEKNAPYRIKKNRNYKAKVRQVLQKYFTNVSKGIWKK